MNASDHRRDPARSAAGSTLVEVMVACVILMVLALAGAACLYQSRGTINVQRNKRQALEVATSQLEALRATGYGSLTNGMSNNFGWQALTNGTVSMNGRTQPLAVSNQYVDVDGSASSYDCVRVQVKVGYRGVTAADRVTLETIIGP